MNNRVPICLFYLTFLLLSGTEVGATPGTAKQPCKVHIAQVLAAVIYRGPPHLVQILERDPQNAERITAESHGDHHLSCTYKILLNSKAYRYEEEFPNTLKKLNESYCETFNAKAQVKKSIIQITERCKEPLARPSWGNSLEPLP